MMDQTETLQFQAEINHLLDLMIHSLYTTKEIFLREVISNASDALDRLRFEALARPELIGDDSRLEIHLETNREARTLTISDTGIGMRRAEIIASIGTIAQSGTRELRKQVGETTSQLDLAQLIGQFGVGFYSCFMVADRVVMVTRRAGEQVATRWESTGTGQYTLANADKSERGTSITLYLKPVDAELGIEDFTNKWVLTRTVKRYSDFISYPIIYREQLDATSVEGAANANEDQRNGQRADEILNSMKPIWNRPEAETAETQYDEFYDHIAHDGDKPLHRISAKAEGTLDCKALLFIPSRAPSDLYYHAAEAGLRLYAKGVLVDEQSVDILPRYLRFIKGVVDSLDLPLNISRQALQQDRHIGQIRKWLTKRILHSLQVLSKNEPDEYLRFWKQFGRALKEGIASDFEHKDKLVSLMRVKSSHDPEKLTTLKDYVARAKNEQKDIFYLTGESREVIENSPHLEAFKAKSYEVLYLDDPVDELMLQYLTEFDGMRLKSIRKGRVELGDNGEIEQIEKELKEKEQACSAFLKFLQNELSADVKEVRLTNRLISSPVCLVGSELDYSPQMERLLQMGKNGKPKQRRIMELNPRSEIFTKMQKRFDAKEEREVLRKYAELLLGYALLAERSELPDPVRFNQLVVDLMAQTL